MKRILKKYNELDEESKELLPFLYIYQELSSVIDNYKNVNIKKIYDKEILMQTIIKCWYSMDLDTSTIIDKLLEILNCRDITIKDFEHITIDELKELMYDDKEKSKIITEFIYKNFYCVFRKNKGKYSLVLNGNRQQEIIRFKEMKDIFEPAIKQYFIKKCLNREIKDYDNESL